MRDRLKEIGVKAQNTAANLVGRPAVWVVFLVIIFVLPMIRIAFVLEPIELPVGGKVGRFDLVDHQGREFTKDVMKGKVWIASATCTSCPHIDPEWIKNIWRIQHRSRNLGDSFRIVSLTVDPETDTQEVLAEYARKNRTSARLWTFVTGDKKEVNRAVGGLFGGGLQGGTGGGIRGGIMVPENPAHLVLVDQNARIRG